MEQFDGNNQPSRVAQHKNRKILRKLGIFLFSLVVAVVIFAAGNISSHMGFVDFGRLLHLKSPLAQSSAALDDEVTVEQLAARLDEVANLIDGDSLYRYTQSDLDTATAEAIDALIATSEDKYAHYFSPEDYDEYLKSTEGEYAGIGISLSVVDEEIVVIEVFEDTPASEAGVKPGDVLVAIDGDRHSWELEDAIEKVRHPAGDQVTITWKRGAEERETALVPREIFIPTVVTHLIEQNNETVGYLSLRGFSMQSASDLRTGLRDLEAAGAQSFILDLRNNPGGYLEQAIDIVSLFVPTGTAVQVENRRGMYERSVTGNIVTDKPLIVLVNENSASASELVAAALQDHQRATSLEKIDNRLARKLVNHFKRACSIRRPGVIAQKQVIVLRQLFPYFFKNGQSAVTRIKNSDWHVFPHLFQSKKGMSLPSGKGIPLFLWQPV
jgi:carboxyl-terminal processing protease